MELSESAKKQQKMMKEIDARAKKDKTRWTIIMIAIIAVILAAAAAVGLTNMKLLAYAFIFAIVAVTITVKLCVAQMGKILERQQSERRRVDNDTRASRFDL